MKYDDAALVEIHDLAQELVRQTTRLRLRDQSERSSERARAYARTMFDMTASALYRSIGNLIDEKELA